MSDLPLPGIHFWRGQHTTPTVVVYIDKQHLGRDCVSERLAFHLPGYQLQPAATIREAHIDGNLSETSLIVLNTHSASLRAAEIQEEVATIGSMAPGVPFILISDLTDVAEVQMAMQLGARGFLPADLSLPQVAAAIRFVGSGGVYIPACVLSAPSGSQPPSAVRPADGISKPSQFTRRQRDVLDRLRQGQQNKVIAYELNMCESTVKVHVRNIMRKLNARNRTQVVLLTRNER